ncbi:hypothetical protein KEM54_005186 [Ascosphaera aggregata]|nr:hypothetical protein KEM54_005186 [Ascosphaera aggregata]
MEVEDPYNWSVDQVVSFFCEEQFASAFQPSDISNLSTVLRENDISGDVLLTDIDRDILKDEFAIRSFGLRARMHRVITSLRQLSQAYAEYTQTQRRDGPIPLTPCPESNATSPVPWELRHKPSYISAGKVSSNSFPTAPVLKSPALNSNIVVPLRRGVDTASSLHASATLKETLQWTSATHVPATPKQALQAVSPPRSLTLINDKPLLQKEVHASSPTTGIAEQYEKADAPRKKRRLEPSQLQTERRPARSICKRCYLPQHRVALHDIFYGDSEDSDDETFLVEGNPCSAGQRLFVHRAMLRYQKQPPQYTKARGKDVIARFPFQNQIQAPGTKVFFTLYAEENDKSTVSKEALADWPEFSEMPEDAFHAYLLAKYSNNDEEPLPVFGDSGSEGGYDSELMLEIEEERGAHEGKEETSSGALTDAEVDTIFDDSVAKFEGLFKEKKIPLYQRKARRIWLRSHRNNSVRDEIRWAGKHIAHLNQRIHDIRKKIHANQWFSAIQLYKQCDVLEPTIFDREEHRWKISILELNECPAKVDTPTLKTKTPRRRLPDGEESLSSDDGLTDFVVSDDERSSMGGDVTATASVPIGISGEAPLSLLQPVQTAVEAPPVQITEPLALTDTSACQPPPFRPISYPSSPRDDDEEDDIRTALQKINRKYESTTPLLSVTPAPRLPKTLTPQKNKDTTQVTQIHNVPSGVDLIDLTLDDDDSPVNKESAPSSTTVTTTTTSFRTTSDDHSVATSNETSVTEQASSASAQRSRMPRRDAFTSKLPAINDVYGMRFVTFSMLEGRKDANRLLARILYSFSESERCTLDRIFASDDLYKRLRTTIVHGWKILKGRFIHKSASSTTRSPAETLAICAASWFDCRSYIHRPGSVPTTSLSKLHNISKVEIRNFAKICLICLEAAGKAKSPVPTIEPEQVLSDLGDTEEEDSVVSPRKKRKRVVPESMEALDIQRNAQRRVENQEKQQRRLARKLERMGVSNEDPERQAVSFSPELYLHPHIGRRVKPHQLKGIQFLFRELVNDKRQQGALLAHTMGLGKTMQVISLLVTIALAGESEEPSIRKQIPEQLRKSRTLILCPSSLIENWWEECLMWIPRDAHTQILMGTIRKVTSLSSPFGRLRDIQEWHDNGGILLLSYDLFRDFISEKRKRFNDDIHASVRSQLLEGPNIIVADEAHKLKNRGAGLSIACSQFRSTSRIALTGSPLSNHLEDYYAMIDWIAPGYLGEFVQFKAKYMEPIEAGLYADSTRQEKRLSLRKLAVLKRDLDPKVQRVDITAISDDLPPKTEFVVTIPLTELQKQAYNTYIESLLIDKVDDVAQTKLWDWLAILSLLCNHPACFMKKLEDRQRKTNEDVQMIGVDASHAEERSCCSDMEDVSSTNRAVSEIPATATARLQKLFSSVPDLLSPAHSYRTQAVDLIVRTSIEIGDKVLIFSHSIPTLDYLETMLKGRVLYSRLDGKTPMCVRQSATKDFNMEDSPTQVYLISMRAGGLGLNIPGANRVIILDFGFNPSWEEQAVGRAYRLGQKKPVYVYRFLAGGTFETIIHNKAVFKTQLSSRVVDKRAPISWATKSNKDYLFNVKEIPHMDILGDFEGKDKILDKIFTHGIIRSLELTETFQRESNEILTPDEQKAVEDEYAEQQLMRNDPEAWKRRLVEATAPRQPPHIAQTTPGTLVPATTTILPQNYWFQGLRAGPPPLQPDTSAAYAITPPTPVTGLGTQSPSIAVTGVSSLSTGVHVHQSIPHPTFGPANLT